MKPKRICFFTTRQDFPRQVAISYYEKIFPRDIEVFIFCRKDGDNHLESKRFKIINCSASKLLIPFLLRRFCRKNKIDVLLNLSGIIEVTYALILATIFTKVKCIYYWWSDPQINLKNATFLLLQPFLDRFLAGSKGVEEKAKKYLFLSRKKIFYLPLPVNTGIFKPKNKNKSRNKLKIGLKDKVLIYVGRIEYMKGSDILFKIIKKNPDKKFILLGKVMDNLYKKKKLDNVIIKVVSNKELVDYYNVADLCIFLSRRDGYSYIPRESMACGTPVVLSDIDAFKQIKTPAAFKVKLDVHDVQDKIDSFFAISKKNRKLISMEGRQFVINDSSEEKMKKITLDKFLNF